MEGVTIGASWQPLQTAPEWEPEAGLGRREQGQEKGEKRRGTPSFGGISTGLLARAELFL